MIQKFVNIPHKDLDLILGATNIEVIAIVPYSLEADISISMHYPDLIVKTYTIFYRRTDV